MKSIITIAIFGATLNCFAVTATKEWVQTATNAVLLQAMAYTDSHAPQVDLSVTNDFVRLLNGSAFGLTVDALNFSSFGQIGWSGERLVWANIPAPGGKPDVLHQFAYTSDVPDISYLLATQSVDHATIQAWQSYWSGDDVRVTVTNYFGQLDVPSLYIEQKMPADSEHDSPWFRSVWDERTRWNGFLAGYNSYTNDIKGELDQKADRAWGYYDSHTGGYSPQGYTQVSSSNILIAAGMAYQRHVTSEGSVWVLESNGLVTQVGGTDAGFFRVEDDDGNAMFEIKKGGRREVGASANSLDTASVNGVLHMTIRYNVVAEEHPKLYTSRTLGTAFVAEDDASSLVDVTWSGSSGAYIADVSYKSSVVDRSAMFVKAGYMVGGETMIKQSVPTELSSIMINGVKYYLGTTTISGQTVLTLRTTP